LRERGREGWRKKADRGGAEGERRDAKEEEKQDRTQRKTEDEERETETKRGGLKRGVLGGWL
jgi:hypothetical protein